MLELSGVSKKYGQATALHPTDLTVPVGRTTVLIGPSGCGKSTLLRLMIGLIQPDTGSVRIDGTPMTPKTALDLRRRMGYVIQDGGLFPHMTARNNVTLMARHLGWSAKRAEARLGDGSPLVRAMAVWALGRLTDGESFKRARARHLPDEPDPAVRAEWGT